MTDFERPTTDPTPGAPASVPPVSQPPTSPTSGVETETTAVPVPTQPIAPPESTVASKPNRTRWFVAAGAIALVIAATTLITLSLTASSPSSVVLGYVPADSTMYGELRLDLPGDQRQKVGQFLSKFPGFADQAALETKLDEVLDRLTSESTNGKQRYTTDIKPWFDGQLAFSVGPIPEMTASDPKAAAKSLRALMLVSVKDEALARTWFSKVFAHAGVTSSSETYQGSELTLFSDPQTPGLQAGFATVGGKVAIVGDATSVKAAIDTKGSSGLAKAPGFAAGDGALKGDEVGFMFFDMKAFMDASVKMSRSIASAPPMSDALRALVPDWTTARLRFEGDALLMDSAFPHVAAIAPAENHANGVAAYAPPSTVALFSGNDFGDSLKKAFAIYRNEPTFAEGFKQLDEAAGLIGGLDAAVGWMGDSGVVVARSGESVEGGLVAIPADAAAGKQLLTQLRSFIQLGGQQAGVTVRDETYNEQTITIVDLGSLRGLAGMAGAMGGLPADPGTLPDGNAEIAYVATDQVVVIGSSPDFVKHVLDAGTGASLADDARFQGLLGRVDAQHTGLFFVDVSGVRTMIEGAMSSASAQERAEYEESVKPFLAPFDALIGTSSVGSTVDQARYVVTVK
jgi:hypothetical protein